MFCLHELCSILYSEFWLLSSAHPILCGVSRQQLILELVGPLLTHSWVDCCLSLSLHSLTVKHPHTSPLSFWNIHPPHSGVLCLFGLALLTPFIHTHACYRPVNVVTPSENYMLVLPSHISHCWSCVCVVFAIPVCLDPCDAVDCGNSVTPCHSEPVWRNDLVSRPDLCNRYWWTLAHGLWLPYVALLSPTYQLPAL